MSLNDVCVTWLQRCRNIVASAGVLGEVLTPAWFGIHLGNTTSAILIMR